MTLDGVDIAEELRWIDEFIWSPVEAAKEATLGAKLIITESVIAGNQGRPITLQSDHAWMKRSDIVLVQSLFHTLGLEMTLILNDLREFNVRFRHYEAPAMTAISLIDTAFPEDETQYNLNLKLVVV